MTGARGCVRLRFYLLDYHEPTHPVEKMKELGYKIIDAVPQSIGDQWWFDVENIIEPLPKYLEVIQHGSTK